MTYRSPELQSRPFGRFTAVASGKGGVGKTWLSVTLAHALAQEGCRVLLLDADFGLANVDVQLGLNPQHDIGAALAGAVPFAAAVTHCSQAGLDVLAGRSGSGSLSAMPDAAMDALLDALPGIARAYDLVLLDLGAGLHAQVRRLAAWADTLLVVATEDPTSLTDAYATLKLHAADRPGGDVRLVVNQASTEAGGARTAGTLIRACESFLRFAPAFAGVVRRDAHVGDAIRRQVPLLVRHPNSPASTDVRRIAQRVRPDRREMAHLSPVQVGVA